MVTRRVAAACLTACLAAGLSPGASAAGAAPAGPAPAGADAPRRVVSINLCTDQLAMMLAAPGQLVSVSWLARDPVSSALADRAADYPVNHALAEEIYLLRPDLVLAGRYGSATTVAMLERLGIPVVLFDTERDFDDLRGNIGRMGDALGRAPQADAMIAQFDRDLAALGDAPGARPSAAMYHANGYTAGDASLSGQILAAAGWRNIAAEAGLPAGGTLALEQLVLANPDLIVQGQRFAGASRAEEVLGHPVLSGLAREGRGTVRSSPDWVCGTPRVLRAVAALRQLRLRADAAPIPADAAPAPGGAPQGGHGALP